ncbi:MAG: large conductance mechanosensitive channel protein MscL [Gaiellales bacterium]|nr:MAG: large conductance mechanosensitive channel protein MscL [Gaiellales bacterium]
MVKEFKEFVLRGNMLDLAVAVVIGAAFGAVITSLVTNIITPVIGAIGGQPDFSGLTFTINKSIFTYGAFINSVIAFLIIAAALFFVVIKPVNVVMSRLKKEEPVDETMRKCPECVAEIPKEAKRCMYCTVEVGPAA